MLTAPPGDNRHGSRSEVVFGHHPQQHPATVSGLRSLENSPRHPGKPTGSTSR